jgi:hypothetical protein
LAFLDYAKSPKYETNTNVSNVQATIANGSKDLVVVDLVSGATLLNSNNIDYKLLSILTFGNFFVFATGNDTDDVMTDDDYILGFGSNTATPYYIFKEVFPNVEVDAFVSGVSDLPAFAKLGVYDSHSVDYIIIAEPVLTQVRADTTAPTYENGYVYADLQEEWSKLHQERILGAALFVKNSSYLSKETAIEEFKTLVYANIAAIRLLPSMAASKLNAYGDLNAQRSKFGLDANLAESVLTDNVINLGFSDSQQDGFLSEVNAYLTLVHAQTLDATHIV